MHHGTSAQLELQAAGPHPDPSIEFKLVVSTFISGDPVRPSFGMAAQHPGFARVQTFSELAEGSPGRARQVGVSHGGAALRTRLFLCANCMSLRD